MHRIRILLPFPFSRWLMVALLMLGFAGAGRAEKVLPTLKSGTVVYSNVTVYSQTEHDLYISHAQGLGNVKISTLDDDSLRALGLKEESQPDTVMARGVSQTMDKLKTSFGTIGVNRESLAGMSEKLKGFQEVKASPQAIGIAAAIAVFVYLFICFCMKLICHNAGAPAGALVWFPLLQMFPLLRAAKMPAWYFLLFLIPVINIIMQIWWCFRIASACGKSALVGVALILPGLNLLAFLYLAFSKGQPEEPADAVQKPIRLDGWASA